MISYTEKGLGLHSKIFRAGYSIEYNVSRCSWIVSPQNAEEEVQNIIDGYTLEECIAFIKAEIDSHAKAIRDQFISNYSAGEMASWAIKYAEANAYTLSKNKKDAKALEKEALRRGVSIEVVAARVLANADALLIIESDIAGVAGKHKDNLSALKSFQDVLAYDWQTGWPGA